MGKWNGRLGSGLDKHSSIHVPEELEYKVFLLQFANSGG
jgi:hypothetical protein